MARSSIVAAGLYGKLVSPRPAIPKHPAAYIRDAYATSADSADMTAERDRMIRLTHDHLHWPEPTVYAEAGPPGPQMTALTEAISDGRHDGVFLTHPSQLGDDLAQIEAFDRLCRQRGVRLRFRWCEDVTDTRALFDVIRDARNFTVTEEHLRLLRRAYVWWGEGEFGSPAIDPKRPYGNSNVFRDIAEILDESYVEPDDEETDLSPDAEWRYLRLHVETAIALQIALAAGEFRTGRYVRHDEDGAWGGREWSDQSK